MRYFTFLKSKDSGAKLLFYLLALSFFVHVPLHGQYCTSNATSTNDEDIASVYLKGNTVTLNNISPTPTCQMYTDYTAVKPADLSAGSTYEIEIMETTCNGHYTYQANAWIDYNQNFVFEKDEAVAQTVTSKNGANSVFKYTFTVPCNIVPGNTRMRVVLIEGTVNNPGNACGTYTWGETEDYTITLQLPTSLSANFAAPSQAWIKSVVKFINANPEGYISHQWDANNDGIVEEPNSINFNYTWNTPGNKCVKLKSTNCLGSDSIVKCVNVQTPTAIPAADFVSNRTEFPIYQSCQIFDLSTNGPYVWTWEVYDSTTYASQDFYPSSLTGEVLPDPDNKGNDEFSQNPEFMFFFPGCYTVVMTCSNDVGPSTPKKKVCYIKITEETDYLLGFGVYGPNSDNVVGSSSGTIMDNGGIEDDYDGNSGLGTRSYLQITPCNAQKITLTMTQLKFNDKGDVLRVWDGKSPGGPGTTLLATWTAGAQAPQSVSAFSGSMYLLFESDPGGSDSGYIGTYTSELGTAVIPTPSFMPNTVPSYNSTPITFNNTTQNIVGVPTWEWSVDGVLESEGKNFHHTLYSDGQYDVCLTIKSCVGDNTTCNKIDVVTPNQQTLLDLQASNRRPNIGVDLTVLKPLSDNANRFEYTIFPTTYTLMNPPSAGSSYDAGFIKYGNTYGDTIPTPILKFNTSGCYTITLKAWNSLDPTNTVKTIVKNKFICALNYCAPNAYILSSDIGINRVKVLDGTTELINHYTTSGDDAYSDYTEDVQATLTYGKKYTLEVTRSTNVDPANRRAWIDWNIDGQFDNSEEILVESSTHNQSKSVQFTVPALSASFEGLTRLRIITNYNNEVTEACGPITAGEIEDYGIILVNDNMKPVITLIGKDTVRIEVGSTYSDAGATAYDPSEGDLTPSINTTNDLDVTVTGIYSYEYNVTDKSGNPAAPVTRVIIVVTDLTDPILTLNPGNTGCITANRENPPYIDPGATATDNKPPFNLTSAIGVEGEVNTRRVGDYTLKYTVRDVSGNQVSKTRNICVVDDVKPEIIVTADTSIQIGTVWFDNTIVLDNYDDFPELIRDWGFSGPVNTTVRKTYPVTYRAYDSSGNAADIKVVNYRVDDFIPPVISLNTFDEVLHDVRTPYNSVQPTVTDNYYSFAKGEVSLRKIGGTPVDYNTLGTYTEVFEAIDASNNRTVKTRTIKVVDRQAPRLWGEIIHGCVGEEIWPMWGISTTDNYYGPDVLLPRVEIVKQNVNIWEEGIYNITYRVTDPSGNTSAEFTRLAYFTYWPKCNNSTVSVEDVRTAEDRVTIYPNPSTGIFNIDLNGALAQNVSIEVYNNVGQVVLRKAVNELTSQYDIDLTGNAAGVYTIKLMADGEVVTKRVILQ